MDKSQEQLLSDPSPGKRAVSSTVSSPDHTPAATSTTPSRPGPGKRKVSVSPSKTGSALIKAVNEKFDLCEVVLKATLYDISVGNQQEAVEGIAKVRRLLKCMKGQFTFQLEKIMTDGCALSQKIQCLEAQVRHQHQEILKLQDTKHRLKAQIETTLGQTMEEDFLKDELEQN